MTSQRLTRAHPQIQTVRITDQPEDKKMITPQICLKKRGRKPRMNSKKIDEKNECLFVQGSMHEESKRRISIFKYQKSLSNKNCHQQSAHQSSFFEEKTIKKQSNAQNDKEKCNKIVKLQKNLFDYQIPDNYPSTDSNKDLFQSKSYRKPYSPHILCVPYRKCHSSIEEKVVNIINKLYRGKQCVRQIFSLLQRTNKISLKQLTNKYFISGLYVIKRLVETKISGDSRKELNIKLQECLKDLQGKIYEELECVKDFRYKEGHNNGKKEFCRHKVIKRAYGILRKKMKENSKQDLREKAIETVNQFLQSSPPNIFMLFEQLSAI